MADSPSLFKSISQLEVYFRGEPLPTVAARASGPNMSAAAGRRFFPSSLAAINIETPVPVSFPRHIEEILAALFVAS